MYRGVENALYERQVRAVLGQIDRVEREGLQMAVNFFVDPLNNSILLFGVSQSEVVGSACTIKELLDEVVGEVRPTIGADQAWRAETPEVL